MDKLYSLAFLALENLGSAAITDEEGRYVYVTQKRLANGSYRMEDMIGKYVHDIYPETMVDHVIKTKTPITMRPMMTKTFNGAQQAFVSYYPLIENDICIGCFLYTTFFGMDAAVNFSQLVYELSQQISAAKREIQRLQTGPANYSTEDIVGESQAIRQLKNDITLVARTSSNVLIYGETGTGKELVAHSIHSLSPRYQAPFVRVNCSAIPSELMESEFFGYEDGAFTGAKKGGKAGKFERASTGTLFLDEIDSLPLSMQPKFLRVIQENEVERVGGNSIISINTRLISATNVNLEEMIRQKAFRQDLYFRLNIVEIRVPPLRNRKEDIPHLVRSHIRNMNAKLGLNVTDVHPSVMEMFFQYSWPGNVRELHNAIERAMNYAYEGTLMPSHFKSLYAALEQHSIAVPSQAVRNSEEDSRAKIIAALQRCKNNKKAAAKTLGWARSTLYKRMRQYGIE